MTKSTDANDVGQLCHHEDDTHVSTYHSPNNNMSHDSHDLFKFLVFIYFLFKINYLFSPPPDSPGNSMTTNNMPLGRRPRWKGVQTTSDVSFGP